MKKNSLIFMVVIVVMSITAFTLISFQDTEVAVKEASSHNVAKENVAFDVINDEIILPNFFLTVGTRFNSITKSELDNTRAFKDFIGDKHANRIVEYSRLSVIILEDSEFTASRVEGTSGNFNKEQLEFISTIKPNTNILIWADYREDDPYTGKIEESHWTPYLTVVPEKQAVYEAGNDALLSYLRNNINNNIGNVDEDKLKPGILYFTISKEGLVNNLRLQNSSGYMEIDERIIELIKNTSGKWLPALNSDGQKVEQELTISFGKGGC